MEEPSLLREIGKVAWFMTKLIVALVSVVGFFALLFRRHPLLGYGVFWGLVFVGQIIFYGWMNYKKNKKKDLEWRKRDEERDRQWNSARTRRENSA